MSRHNYGAIVADAWDQAMTLGAYGTRPLTVGWWRGAAFVRVWNYRTGQMTWKPFQTARPMTLARRSAESKWHSFTSEWFLREMGC